MEQESLFGFKVWLFCMLSGTFILCVYLYTQGNSSLLNFPVWFLILTIVAAIRSIPALLLYTIFLQLHYSSGFKKHTKNIYNYLMCYLLCFLTLYGFFLRNKDFPENLLDPLLWIVFLSYSIGASLAIYYLHKKYKRKKIQKLESDTLMNDDIKQYDQKVKNEETNNNNTGL